MSFGKKLFAGVAISLAVAACATLPPAQSFREELSKQYSHLFNPNNKPMRGWFNSHYFAGKAAQVNKGVDVQPEQPTTWNVPREQLPEINNAYDMLQIALVPDRKKVTAPIPAARAQAYFDCWVEQAHQKWTPTKGSDCRAAFYEAFCQMYGNQCKTQVNDDSIFRVYFDFDKFNVDAAGRRAVMAAVTAYSKGANEIIVAGHADKSGSADYNVQLSKARADAVRKLLIDNGIPAEKITDRYFGEGHPLVKTADGVKNRSNRRVLVVVR